MSEFAGPVTVSVERRRSRAKSRFELECACGWRKSIDGADFLGSVIAGHLQRQCSAVILPSTRRGQPWTPDDDAQLWNGTVREVADLLGRSKAAISSRRLIVTRPEQAVAAAAGGPAQP